MNITREDKGTLTAVVKVEIAPEDYQEQVTKVLKDYQKQAKIPGFRPGKIPFGMVKKQYGASARLDEVNKVLSDAITKYIADNKLNVLGQPLPSEEKAPTGDFSKDDSFEFWLEIGLSPEIKINLEEIELDYHTIRVDKAMIDKYVENICRQHGTQESVDDKVIDGDIVKGKIEELDKTGVPKEGGIVNEEASLSVDFIKDEEIKKKIIGMQKDDVVTFNPLTASDNNTTETSSMLGVKAEEVENLESDFQFTVTDITRLKLAELNEDLFVTVFPAEDIKTEDDFRKKIKADSKKSFEKESARLLLARSSEKFIEILKLDLPDEFLKRWILQNDEKLTKEQLESDYENYSNSMKWQLIESTLVQDNKLQVSEQEVRDQISGYFTSQMGGAVDPAMQEQMKGIVDSMMKNEQQVKQIYDQLYDERLAELLVKKAKLNKKAISYDKFIELANPAQK
ncbi:MAG: trigger factor [Bacteroidota bacterium]|nr:trigger factor [Bacteroidota bacterium]